jgi:hypothetical protein
MCHGGSATLADGVGDNGMQQQPLPGFGDQAPEHSSQFCLNPITETYTKVP